MPRIRQKADVYRNEDFRRDVKVQMAYYGLSQKETAQQIGIGNSRMSELMRSAQKIFDLLVRTDVCTTYEESIIILDIVRGAIRSATGKED